MNTALAIVEPTKNYNSPDHYRCGDCGVTSVRLWREYNTFLDRHLYCRYCAIKNQKKTPEDIEEAIVHNLCSIGFLVPAVPTRDGSTFWGYSSVPQGLCNWWYSLPSALDETLPVDQWSLVDVLNGFKLSKSRAELSGRNGAMIKLGERDHISVCIESAPKFVVKKAENLRSIIDRDTIPDGEKQAARYALARLGRGVTARIDAKAPSVSVATLRDLGAILAGIADDYNEAVTTQALRTFLGRQLRKNPAAYAGVRAYTDVDLRYRFERHGTTICEGDGPIFPEVEYDLQKSSCERAIRHLNIALKISPVICHDQPT